MISYSVISLQENLIHNNSPVRENSRAHPVTTLSHQINTPTAKYLNLSIETKNQVVRINVAAMATVHDPPRQPKQPSRKGKKAWRKNVDITEVQEGLENLREEVSKG